MTSIDTLDMAVQRICKTSKDLRHEVDCFWYYTVQFICTCCFRLYMGDSSFEMGTYMYLLTSSAFGNSFGVLDKFKMFNSRLLGIFSSLIAIAALVLIYDIPFESF